ncbi:MAG TPA: hypothetical protein VND91_01745 [Candidatus Saccharimonadia bacterium]|nr:hypothetical protein [Candidatus Saccharimonadia bacterium]
MKLRYAFGIAAMCVGFGVSAASTVQIENTSSWDIHQLFISPTTEEEWGEDLLGENVAETGQTITLSAVPCADYDVRLVDEDGDVCVVSGIALCESKTYTLDDDDLLSCQSETEE